MACGSAPPCPAKAAPKPERAPDELLGLKHGIEAMVLAAYQAELVDVEHTHKKIRVLVGMPSSNLGEDLALSAFIWQSTASYLDQQVSIEVTRERGVGIDAVLDQHVIATRDATGKPSALSLLAVLRDARTGLALAGTSLPITSLPRREELLAFKQELGSQVQAARAESRILIRAKNVGKGYETHERVSEVEYTSSSSRTASVSANGGYRSSRGSGSGSGYGSASGSSSERSTRSYYRNVGTSGWYPMEQVIALNGAQYKPDRDGLFVDDGIPPGHYEVSVSFREGFWDAAQQRQKAGKKFERVFQLDVAQGEHVELTVVFTCDEDTREIEIVRH